MGYQISSNENISCLLSFILVYFFMAKLGPAYPGSSVGGPEGVSQPSMSSRHSSMLGGAKEADMSGYRGHPSAGAHYGGQYSSVYSSAGLSSGQQVCILLGFDFP